MAITSAMTVSGLILIFFEPKFHRMHYKSDSVVLQNLTLISRIRESFNRKFCLLIQSCQDLYEKCTEKFTEICHVQLAIKGWFLFQLDNGFI